jgi:glycosyltransferase involved in cell wall biosynthesis
MEEQELISALDLTGRVKNVGFVSDAHLAKLYRCSEALVYPSLYEGFGIPPLEAMSCGTLVICSNTSSLPEVVGDAAIMIDPTSVDELADAMLSLRSISGRERLVEKGKKRAALFAWAETAKRTADLYEKIAR